MARECLPPSTTTWELGAADSMSKGAKTKPRAARRPAVAGQGERNATGGLIRQWNLAARLIYEAIASGRLAWVGLADRGAGQFDDVVLGLTDGTILAHQVKTSQHPEPFYIETM